MHSQDGSSLPMVSAVSFSYHQRLVMFN